MFLTGVLVTRLENTYPSKETDMMDYVNVTPLIEPNVRWEQYAPYEPKMPARASFNSQTNPTTSRETPFQLFKAKTGIHAPTPNTGLENSVYRRSTSSDLAARANAIAVKTDPESEVEVIAKQRVRLMAAKYADDKVSTEILARLEILNQRMISKSPRVTREQVESLEGANEKLSRIRIAREERSKRLGITA